MRALVRRAVFAIAALLALSSASATGQSAGDRIRVGVGPDDDSLPLVYAAQAGLFQRAGLNVELERLSGGAAVSAALAGNSLEIGKAASASAIAAYARGLPFTVIGSVSYYDAKNPNIALLVDGRSGIRTAKDLIGQTLGAVSLQDLGSLGTFAWLDQRGVDWHDVRFLEIPASAALPAIEARRIVGMPVYEPFYSSDVATGEVRVIGYPFDAIADRFTVALMLANVAWVNDHPELVGRFLQTLQQASTYVAAHERELVPMLAQFSGADPALLSKIKHNGRGVAITPGDLQPVIDIEAKYGVIPKAFPAAGMICSCALHS